MTEQRERAAARRAETDFENRPPPPTPPNFFCGDRPGDQAPRPGRRGGPTGAGARSVDIFGDAPPTGPSLGKRIPTGGRAPAPFADHEGGRGDDVLAAYAAHRASPQASPVRAPPPAAAAHHGPSPQDQARMFAARNRGSGGLLSDGTGGDPPPPSPRANFFEPPSAAAHDPYDRAPPPQRNSRGAPPANTNFFSGESEPNRERGSGRRNMAERHSEARDLLSGGGPPPEQRANGGGGAPLGDALGGYPSEQRAYAVRANVQRGSGESSGARGGAPSYGGANGNGGQNIGNSIGDRNSTRIMAPPGGFSSISFG